MLRVGLTGNRFSGKNTICKLFRQVRVPVFDSDVILKYILNYELGILYKIKDTIGYEYFEKGRLNTKEVIKDKKFKEVLKLVKPYILDAYSKFEKKHSDSVYTIFQSSILIESDWNEDMDITICISAPKEDRVNRGLQCTNLSKRSIEKIVDTEMGAWEKNNLSDIVIYNYGIFDVLDQVSKTDNKIVDFYLKSKIKEKPTLPPIGEIYKSSIKII
jgi:dephospho-CoA kinase